MKSQTKNRSFDRYEEFLSAITNEDTRKNYLSKLNRGKLICEFLVFFSIALFFVGMIMDGGSNSVSLVALLILVTQVMIYSSIDSSIRTIRLYEILSLTDKKP